MTSKERMLRALALEKPDRLPATIHQWQQYHLDKYMGGVDALTVLALPVLALAALAGRRRDEVSSVPSADVLILWAACGLAVIYLPAPFQRKMLEGLHIPLCILGGIALLYVVGGGLIYIIYGREAAITGVICLSAGLSPLILAWLALNLVGWIARRADPDR